MQLKIKKEIEETISIDLSIPKYYKFLDSIFMEFTERTKGKPRVKRFYQHPDAHTFEISVRPLLDNDCKIFMGEKGWEEIDHFAFYGTLSALMDKFNVAQPETIEP